MYFWGLLIRSDRGIKNWNDIKNLLLVCLRGLIEKWNLQKWSNKVCKYSKEPVKNSEG